MITINPPADNDLTLDDIADIKMGYLQKMKHLPSVILVPIYLWARIFEATKRTDTIQWRDGILYFDGVPVFADTGIHITKSKPTSPPEEK